MTNLEIIERWNNDELSHYELVELARQDEREKLQTEIGHLEYKIEGLQQALSRNKDEREKMQGVDCYVSWDDGKFESPAISIQKPTMGCKLGGKFYTGLGQNITIPKEDGVKLGVSPGQCKKVRIVEVGNEG